ncbi:serine/threonine kinase [Aureococcus anophagefferens]|nr:serine/threonine kinase [Aureococcus anophagefferens]
MASDDLRTSLRAAALGAGLDLGASADFDARPRRLLREATILSKITHPNVVRYVGCYEGPDALRVVLERAPGRELFEVILERRSLPEADARPVVAQLTSALAYLHANAVAHRDVKPENVLVDRRGDEWRGTLIDFGLSKVIKTTPSGDDDDLPVLESSAGRTFVGTPCYLAPEIEAIHRGGEGAPRHYGVEVDAWSLGAVLHVSLVARFPEFDRSSGRPLVKVDGPAFARVSAGARDLVGRLMDPDPATRLATGDARAHAWLAAAGETSPPPPAPETRDELSRLAAPRGAPTAFEIDSLVELQQSIGACLGGAFESYAHLPEMSQRIRGCAVLCRSQLLENTKLLRKIEQTAAGALDLHEDLELSVASGEPPLALQLLTTCKNAAAAAGRARAVAAADYDMDDGLDDSVVADRAACSYGPNQGKVEDALAARKTAAAALEVARGAPAPAAAGARDSDPAVETLTARLGSTLDVDGGVIFDNLLQKSEHIEQFLEYSAAATSPERRIMGRFHQRLAEYKMFWLKVRDMAHATLHK